MAAYAPVVQVNSNLAACLCPTATLPTSHDVSCQHSPRALSVRLDSAHLIVRELCKCCVCFFAVYHSVGPHPRGVDYPQLPVHTSAAALNPQHQVEVHGHSRSKFSVRAVTQQQTVHYTLSLSCVCILLAAAIGCLSNCLQPFCFLPFSRCFLSLLFPARSPLTPDSHLTRPPWHLAIEGRNASCYTEPDFHPSLHSHRLRATRLSAAV